MSNVFIQLGNLTQKLDVLTKQINALEEQGVNITNQITEKCREFENIKTDAEALAEKNGIPFVYSFTKDDEDTWESSDDDDDYWNSSNC